MKLVNKDALLTEIEDIESTSICEFKSNQSRYAEGSLDVINRIKSFLDTLEVKEVDLEKEIDEVIHNYKLNNHRHTSICSADIEWIAEHFFEFGVKASQENNVIGTLEREVKIDAGGYPYINCDIEFYDYNKDIPLAKEGDKVKVVIIKGE